MGKWVQECFKCESRIPIHYASTWQVNIISAGCIPAAGSSKRDIWESKIALQVKKWFKLKPMSVQFSLIVQLLTLSLPSSKRPFSQPFKEKCYSEVVRTGSMIIFNLNKLWKAKFVILCDVIFLQAAGEIWTWSLLGVINELMNDVRNSPWRQPQR